MIAQKERRQRRTAKPDTTTAPAGAQKCSIGWIAAQWSDDGQLRGITIGHPSPAAALSALNRDGPLVGKDQLSAEKQELLDRLCAYADGANDSFHDVPVNLDHLSAFASTVVRRCRQIPLGETMTYAQLAAACGSPRAARAVGNVMSSNRFPLVVPCHRVVGAGGGLGGFSAPQGVRLKRQLIHREGVEI